MMTLRILTTSVNQALHVFVMQVLPLANQRNAELAIPSLSWLVNCIKIGGHVALQSDPTVHFRYCALNILAYKSVNYAWKGEEEQALLLFFMKTVRL